MNKCGLPDCYNNLIGMCRGCLSIGYCSLKHQKKDWVRHKPDCNFQTFLNSLEKIYERTVVLPGIGQVEELYDFYKRAALVYDEVLNNLSNNRELIKDNLYPIEKMIEKCEEVKKWIEKTFTDIKTNIDQFKWIEATNFLFYGELCKLLIFYQLFIKKLTTTGISKKLLFDEMGRFITLICYNVIIKYGIVGYPIKEDMSVTDKITNLEEALLVVDGIDYGGESFKLKAYIDALKRRVAWNAESPMRQRNSNRRAASQNAKRAARPEVRAAAAREANRIAEELIAEEEAEKAKSKKKGGALFNNSRKTRKQRHNN